MTTTCSDCDRSRAGLWCGYRYECADCCARAVARSLPAFEALHPRGKRDPDPLRDAIQRAMPTTDYAAARRMVWAWWQHDHPPEQKAHATP